MECRDVERLLPDYSVGLLKPRQEQAIASHLGACPGCGREWETLQGVLRLVEEHGALEPPAGLWNGVYNRIVEDAPAPAAPGLWERLWSHPARVLGPALATAALAAAFWLSNSPPAIDGLPLGRPDREFAGAVREHALASAGGLFADRAGLESLAVLASHQAAEER